MEYKFEQGEIVEFNHPKFGKGKGGVVGYCFTSDEYVIYPKIQKDYEGYPFMTILVKPENLISTPF